MKNIPGVSYPIDESVLAELSKLPSLAHRLSPLNSRCSNLEIVRLLGNTHYGRIKCLLRFLDENVSTADTLVGEILKQTDLMEFEGKLAELYLWHHIADRLPDCVKHAEGLISEKHPDMVVSADDLDVAVEVYSPIGLFGFQLIEKYTSLILKYLEIEIGYDLKAQIKPISGYDPFYAYDFETEEEIRPWLREFAIEAASWLSSTSPQSVFEKVGPNPSSWKLSVAIEELHRDRRNRQIIKHAAGRSDDPRLHFEVGTEETTANGRWGRSVRKKMAERQAGPAPEKGLLRLLVVDFSRLDTAFPDFICWPRIVERIKATVKLLASQIGGEPPYDAVLPARLGLSCCFGPAVWLEQAQMERRRHFFDQAGLTIPCDPPRTQELDWSSVWSD